MFSRKISRWEEQIRNGEVAKAAKEIMAEDLTRVPRKYFAVFANLSRRCQQPKLTLKMMGPLLRERPNEASEEETVEYTLALMQLDLHQEAMGRLSNINSDRHPQVLLYRASMLARQWNYAELIPLLHQYISLLDNEYAIAVGRLNLAAAHVALKDFLQAEGLLREIKALCEEKKWHRLLANIHEVYAQVAIHAERWGEARSHLEVAKQMSLLDGTLDELFCEKWRAIIDARELGQDRRLLDFQSRALSRRHWETVRFVDYQLVKMSKPGFSADYLFHGTPYSAFRKRIVAESPSQIAPTFCMNGSQQSVFNLSSGELNGHPILRPGSINHKFIAALCEDFYRPPNLTVLFGRLFPGEYYDFKTSPNRTHQALVRVRRWIANNKLPLEILAHNQNYFLIFSGPLCIEKNNTSAPETKIEHFCHQLYKTFGGRSFSTREASEALNLGYSNCTKILKRALQDGKVERLGSGRNTVYVTRKAS